MTFPSWGRGGGMGGQVNNLSFLGVGSGEVNDLSFLGGGQ